MSESTPLETESQINARAFLESLALMDSPLLLSEDELVCLRILREAAEDIIKGGDISPAPEGQHKLRLIRRVHVGFFVATAPRPSQVITQPIAP